MLKESVQSQCRRINAQENPWHWMHKDIDRIHKENTVEVQRKQMPFR